MKNEKLAKYPKTELFEVVDTIGVPHPYTVGPKHVKHASKYGSGMLGERTMRAIQCCHPGCNLTLDQHEQALAIRCKTTDEEPTREYLKSIFDQCKADGFSGFVLIDATKE